VYTFFLDPPAALSFEAGQHGLLSIPGVGRKAFSLASAPEDEHVAIGTRIRPGSAYRSALAALAPRARVTLRGPLQDFTVTPSMSRVVLLAQGIGITPFRSILRHLPHSAYDAHTTLIHVARANPTYRDETAGLATVGHYPTEQEEFALQLKRSIVEDPTATFFVSGGSPFLAATTAVLTAAGIGRARIKKDRFRGY
jgi:ferredoxin-NADP reductase